MCREWKVNVHQSELLPHTHPPQPHLNAQAGCGFLMDPRGKAEAWSTEDNLAKNYGSRNKEHELQLGHHPEAGQRQTGVEELC